MDTPMITWISVVALVAIVAATRFIIDALHNGAKHSVNAPHHIIDSSTEREMFFLPGDPDEPEADEDYE